MTLAGLPHSGISGSTPACGSPELIAANHALHRLLAPRHPPCALSSLTINPFGHPPRLPSSVLTTCRMKDRVRPKIIRTLIELPRRFAFRTVTCFRVFVRLFSFQVLQLQRWRKRDSNPRPSACKADALPTELFPRLCSWWAWKDLNFRPHAYQACALTN